jgi:hypothetical protein
MNTKTSILTALVALASGTAAMAQVYSQNVVGYVNANLTVGFNQLANPLVNGVNPVNAVVPTAPTGALLYTLQANGTYKVDLYNGTAWIDGDTEEPSTTTLNPGQGFMIYTAQASAITFVGEVKQGTSTVPLTSGGFSLLGSVAPQTYQLLPPEFPAVTGMLHYALNAGGTYDVSLFNGSIWIDGDTEEPRQVFASPGKAFFIYSAGAANPWIRTFNVN